MKTNTDVLEEITAEIARLEKQRDAAEAEAQRAAERLEELSARRATLAPGPLSNEWEGAEVLASLVEAMKGEAEALSCTRAMAEDTAHKLARLVLHASVRRQEEEKRLAWGRYEALCEERYSLDSKAEEVMARLVEVLDCLEDLHTKQIRAAADADNSSLAYHDPRDTVENWLARRLRCWLSNGSFERYDAPLPELDPLARNPEADDELKPETKLAER